MRIDPASFSFEESSVSPRTDGWSEETIAAIVKSPQWLHRDLINQFETLADVGPYVELLLEASTQTTDELAFCIAHSPLGNVPSPQVLKNNVDLLYQIDSTINYADIIDYESSEGSYYSTIQYHIKENATDQHYELPREIYYWYIVHPSISGEDVEPIYERFWRSFLYRHNDRGYPLLQELTSDIAYLWDLESYAQPNMRIWTEWINLHPTAIEMVSYWIGKTVPFFATGDRPVQPNIIAHEHNGYCGELQTLAVAAQRTVLIPSIGINNIGEDHVWRAFYHKGWHQGDNWWADSGGCIDVPHVYTDGWGKEMSAIFAEKGDGCIIDMTSAYLHSKDIITVNFSVVDGYLNPYDNARITVLVKGLKDITWYQYKLIELLDSIWNRVNGSCNNTIIETWYQKLCNRILTVPEVIDTALITTWNYTDRMGQCSFSLGKSDEYIFLIQSPSTDIPWPLARHSSLRLLKDHNSKDFVVILPDFSRKPVSIDSVQSQGPFLLNISSTAEWNELHQNIKTKNIGVSSKPGDVDVLVLDEENLQRFQQQKPFTVLQQNQYANHQSSVCFDSPIYVVLRNPTLHASLTVDIALKLTGIPFDPVMHIDTPRSALFIHPMVNCGDIVNFNGYASNSCTITVDDSAISYPKGNWFYMWNTSGCEPGTYMIHGSCEGEVDTKTIQLIDVTPPEITITNPAVHQIFYQSDGMICSGYVDDDSPISSITILIDNRVVDRFEQKEEWDTMMDLSTVTLGIHTLSIIAVDNAGNSEIRNCSFVLIDDTAQSSPRIDNQFFECVTVRNWTAVTVYAEVTSNPIYPVETMKIGLFHKDYFEEKPMFLYGDNPALDRHPEDPLLNQSNTPIYGCFLGDFQKGDTIAYWIEVTDVSGSSTKSALEYIEL